MLVYLALIPLIYYSCKMHLECFFLQQTKMRPSIDQEIKKIQNDLSPAFSLNIGHLSEILSAILRYFHSH